MNVILSDRPVRLILSSSRVRSGAAVIEHGSARDTYRYLQSRASRPGVAAELRELMNSVGARPLAANEDVLYVVAAKVAQKQLFLLQMEEQSAGGAEPEPAVPAPAVSKRAPVSATPPPPPPPATKPAPEAAAPTAPEPTSQLLQDIQAQSLESAAASGTPFCAICAQAKAASQQVVA